MIKKNSIAIQHEIYVLTVNWSFTAFVTVDENLINNEKCADLTKKKSEKFANGAWYVRIRAFFRL